jgi:hypothetical protein
MAFYGSPDVGFVLVDGYNLTGDVNELDDEGVEPICEERTSFGDTWHRHQYIGLSRALGLKHRSFYDDVALGSLAAVQAGQGTSRQFSYNVEGNAIGKKFVSWAGALQTKYVRVSELMKLHRIAAEYKGNGEQYNAAILQPFGAVGASTVSTTSIDNTAGTTAGGCAILHVTAISGTLDATVQHSTDNSVWSTLAAFTQSSAIGAKKVVLSSTATVHRYVRVTWTASAATTFVVGFARG